MNGPLLAISVISMVLLFAAVFYALKLVKFAGAKSTWFVIASVLALSHEDALCCGGGGNLEMVDGALVKDIGHRKLQLALDTGAQTIVSACQQCKRTIAATARAEKTRLRVLDITELVWQAVENGMT